MPGAWSAGRKDSIHQGVLTEQYKDLPLGIVDASVIALAERRQRDTIATLDHRHFATVKPRHIDAFTLVP